MAMEEQKKEKKKKMPIHRMNLTSKFISEFKVQEQENTIEHGGKDRKYTAVYGILPFSHCSSFTIKVVKDRGGMGIGLVDAELSN